MLRRLEVVSLSWCLHPVVAPITKPYGEWICNYCSMGADDDPETCGLPILCIFYGLLFVIILTFLYQTIKGERDFRKHDQITPHMSVVKR